MRPDDETLAGRFLGGDTAAFEALFERYEKTIYNVAFRMVGDRDAARDITQNVFLKAFDKLATFDTKQRFFSWLYRIAINESIDFNAKRRPADTLDDRLPDPDAGPADDLRRAEERAAVQRALMTLSDDHRTVIVLRHFLGCSYAEMSDVLELPATTVKSRLFDSRRALRNALVELGLVRGR